MLKNNSNLFLLLTVFLVGTCVMTTTVTVANGIVPTFTAQSDFFIQTTITFSEGISGTLNFSEWSFAGNTPTAVSGYVDGDTLSGIEKLVFIHNITNDYTPDVNYIGTSLVNSASDVLATVTVTAANGIPSTFTKSYSTTQSTYIGAQETTPHDVAFSNDGAKMFVLGTASNAVHEYKLSVPFNVTSSNFTANSDVSPQIAAGFGITFSPNGAKMFVVGLGSGSGSATVYEYALSTPFNVTSYTFTDSIYVGSETSSPSGIVFSTNGTKMFIVGNYLYNVIEYALSTPFNVTSSTFTDSIYVGSQVTTPTGVTFSTNGAKMFIVGSGNDAVYEYALSTPFNVTSSTFTDSISIGSQDTSPTGVTFSTNGAKMFIVGLDTDKVYEYTLPTPFDLYALAFTARSYSPTQTTVTFSEGLSGTLVLSEWSIDGNVPTAVLEHSDGDTLSGTTFLVFTHDTTNDQTPNVAYTGSSLTDNSSFAMAIATVTAADGIVPTFTAQSDFFIQTTVTFNDEISGTLNFSEWSFAGNTPTAVSGHADGATLSNVTELVFTHDITNDRTPDVKYTGTSLADSTSVLVPAATVTAYDGFPITTITSITSNVATSNTLKVGDTITFTLTPDLAEIAATIDGTFNSQSLNWSTVNNGTTYTATYTVSEGDADQTTPLQITNVTITNSAGSTSLPFDGTDILNTIDANSPQFSSAQTLSISQIAITLDHNVTDSNAISNDFTLGGVTGGSIGSIVSVSNNIITLGITGATISDSDDVTISYARTFGSFDDVSGNSLLDFAGNVANTLDTTIPTFCTVSSSGDWIITTSCTLDSSATATRNVIVQNDSILSIPSGITLNIDFAAFNLTVQSGSGVLIKSGGAIT